MDLYGAVSLRLTAEGAEMLREALPSVGPFEAFVMDSDATGLWILVGDASGEEDSLRFPVLLVKWEYIATLFSNYKLPPPPARRAGIGFHPSANESGAQGAAKRAVRQES
jgi:hypothetical protein